MYYVVVLALAAVLGIIPGSIARDKGYSFGLWWFYGWMLFIVAIIHVSLIPDKNNTSYAPIVPYTDPRSTQPPYSAADEIQKYKQLLDVGAITQEEFDAKKRQLLWK